MQFRVTDLLIEAAKKKAPRRKTAAPKIPCGKPTTCYRCTKCTSTAMSRHKPGVTINTCDQMHHEADIRAELLAQLREIVAGREAA